MTPCTHRLSQETQNSEQVSQDCGPSSSSLSSPISHVEYTATTSEPPLTSESDNHSLVQRTAYHVQPITQTYRGRARGIQNYSVSDRMTLLDSIEKHQPISSELWEKVHADYSQYAARLGRTERTVHSLQEAFRAMCYHRLKPTGNPQCPDYVQRAKQLAIEIRKSALDSTEGCSSRSSSDQSRGSLTPTPGIHTASSSTSTTSSANCTTEAALERARTWASAADGI
ncbi:hypothetical protein EDC01DRAFT_679490, partial [Geopyxis carbonaria]